MKKKGYIQRKDIKKVNLRQLLIGLAIIVVLNIAGSKNFFRIDMTSEKRYSLTSATKDLIRNLDDIVYFRVYLEGNFPAEFRRLRNETREMLDEFSAYNDYIEYDFINPSSGEDREQIDANYQMLMESGLEPTQLQVRADDATSQQVVFPGAIVSFRGKEIPLDLLNDQINVSTEEMINSSVQALEYNLASVLRKLTVEDKPLVAFLEGHNELTAPEVAAITNDLSDFYDVKRLKLNDEHNSLDGVKTLIVADPKEPFSEEDKFIIDQYIMQGGSVLWLINPVYADMDSLKYGPETIGMNWPVNIDDMLFRYGARLNANLVQDQNAVKIPITTGYVGSRPQINMLPWVFFPMVSQASEHPVVKNINAVRTEFVSSIDTVGGGDIQKTNLLQTSPYSRVLRTPARISLDILQNPPSVELFNDQHQIVAVLLEGEFESVFKNRPLPGLLLPADFTFMEKGEPSAQIVVSDGSMAKNQFDQQGNPLPLGYDRYSRNMFGNRDFILNAVNYLADDTGIMEARAKDVRLRILDRRRVQQNRYAIQVLNIGIPVLIVILFALIKRFLRNIKYSKKIY